MRKAKDRRAELREQRRQKKLSDEEFDTALDELLEERDEIRDHLKDVEDEIEKFETKDPRMRVALPDSASDEAKKVDLEEIKARVLGLKPGQHRKRTRARRRYWITVTELAKVAGVTEKAVRSWLRENDPVKSPGTPVFVTAGSPAIELGSSKRRVIPVEALNPEWLDEVPARRTKLEQLQRAWPAEDKWKNYRQERHELPEQLRAELEQLQNLEARLSSAYERMGSA